MDVTIKKFMLLQPSLQWISLYICRFVHTCSRDKFLAAEMLGLSTFKMVINIAKSITRMIVLLYTATSSMCAYFPTPGQRIVFSWETLLMCVNEFSHGVLCTALWWEPSTGGCDKCNEVRKSGPQVGSLVNQDKKRWLHKTHWDRLNFGNSLSTWENWN